MRFVIHHKPISQKRSRSTRWGHHYNSQHAEIKEVQEIVKSQLPEDFTIFSRDTPLRMHLVFLLPPPKHLSKKKLAEFLKSRPTKKPDNSNVVKFYEDALNGIVWEDDCSFVETFIEKYNNEIPGVIIKVESIED